MAGFISIGQSWGKARFTEQYIYKKNSSLQKEKKNTLYMSNIDVLYLLTKSL